MAVKLAFIKEKKMAKAKLGSGKRFKAVKKKPAKKVKGMPKPKKKTGKKVGKGYIY